MADELIFYTNPMSRGRIVRWMLEEVGAPYTTEQVDYAAVRSDAHRAVNPMGKVPVIRHGTRVVTETAAICAYLADAFPDAGLAPPTAERADYYRWLFYAAGPVEHAITNRALGVTPTEQQQRMTGYGCYELVVAVLDEAVAGRGYVAGDRFSAADVYLGSQILFGLRFGTLPKRDAFTRYAERLSARDPYRRATELDDALLPSAA